MLTTANVVYAAEPLTDAFWNEIQPLLHKHYDEISAFHDILLDPDKEAYERINANKALRIFTARTEEGVLIGYAIYFVARSLHYRSQIFANQDILYVDPAYRGTRIGISMIKFSHDSLQFNDRVTMVLQHTKAKESLNIGKMLKRIFGYEILDEIYVKRLG